MQNTMRIARLLLPLILLLGLMSMSAHAQTNMTGRLEHPCVLVNAEMLPQLRAAAADAELNRFGFSTAEIWQGLLARADEFLAAPPYHYHVDMPQGGGKPPIPWEYTLSDATPPPHDELPAYPPWTAMTQEQRGDAITVRIKALAAAYLITGEIKYAERAKTIVMHLTHWDCWSDPSYGRGTIKACLDTGHLTKCVGLFYDWCYDMLSEQERAMIRDAIVAKGIKMIVADVGRYPPETNGYAVLTAGLACAALAIRPEDPNGGEYLAKAIEFTKTSFDLCGKDGGLFEGPGYGTYLLDNFAHVLDAVTTAEVETDLFQHPFLATMPIYTISHMTPDGHVMPCFSDGSPTAGYPETMSILTNRGSTEAAWYLQQIDAIEPATLHQCLRFNPDNINPVQPTFNPSRPFVDIGYAILRDGYKPHTPYLAFKSGPFDNPIGHNHYDHNSFVISYLGEWIITDRGYHYRYDAAMRKFSLGTIGHASAVLDIDDNYMQETKVPDLGHDQVHKTGGKIEKFFSCEALDYVQGQAAPAYNTKDQTVLDDFTRNLFYFKPYFFVMVDHLAAPQPHSYNIPLQAGPNSLCERVEGDHWTISGIRTQLACWMYGSQGITTASQLYPGAERYGPFLRAYTDQVQEADFVTLMYPRALYGSSLVRNGGFEHQMLGWSPRANEDLPNHVIDTEVKHGGAASGRIDRSGYYYTPKLPIEPGTTVKAVIWLKTAGTTTGGATMVIHFFDAKKSFRQVNSGGMTPTDWTKIELQGTAPEGTERVCLALNYSGDGQAWYDDVTFEILDPPATPQQSAELPEVTALEDGARGLTATLAGTQFALLTAGGPIQAGDHLFAHDGSFAAISTDTSWHCAYLQEGTFLEANGNRIIAVDRDQPVTVALWRGDNNTVQVLMADSLVPHAPPVPASDIKLQVFSSRPIEHAYSGATELSLKTDGNIYTIAGD